MSDPERRYRETLDSLLEGFQILGREWRYLYVNPAAAAHARTTSEALVGRRIMDVWPGFEETNLYTVLARCMETGTGESLENHFDLGNGVRRWFELRIEPVPEGLCIHSVDIEDRKEAEAALRGANLDLERRIAERTAELQEANRELEAFSYSVAHDLRTPLRSIDGFAQLLVDDCGDQLSDEGKDYLRRVRGSAQRMATLIDDLLSLSRVTLTPIERSDISLSDLARSVASEIDPDRRVLWQIAPGVRAWCDPALARIVLENLLGNACKFTSKVERPVVAFRKTTDGGAFVVEDNGAGFDMTHARRLFTPFHRMHDEREFTGTGIGLSTVARIVRKHEGTIRAEGVVNRGATITFSLEPEAGSRPTSRA